LRQFGMARLTKRLCEVNLNLPAKLSFRSNGEQITEQSTSGSSAPGRSKGGRSGSSGTPAPRRPSTGPQRHRPCGRDDRQEQPRREQVPRAPYPPTHHHQLLSPFELAKRNHDNQDVEEKDQEHGHGNSAYLISPLTPVQMEFSVRIGRLRADRTVWRCRPAKHLELEHNARQQR
jgi:hypothetical protein